MLINEIERNTLKKKDVVLIKDTKPKDRLPFKINGYDVCFKQSIYNTLVTVWNDNEIIAKISMKKTPYGFYKVFSAGVKPFYQGNRIGENLYRNLITKADISLISSDSHSPGARKLWLRLARDPEISAWGFDKTQHYEGRSGFIEIFPVTKSKESEELTGVDREVYTSEPDVEERFPSIVLTKRNGPVDRKLTELSTKKIRDFNVSEKDVFSRANK